MTLEGSYEDIGRQRAERTGAAGVADAELAVTV